jgi:hypothetical protein
MASRSSSSTASSRTSMRSPSDQSRSEVPSQGRGVTETSRPPNERASARGPAQKKHKSLEEVRLSGRQSDQGDRPKAAPPPPSNRRSASRSGKK